MSKNDAGYDPGIEDVPNDFYPDEELIIKNSSNMPKKVTTKKVLPKIESSLDFNKILKKIITELDEIQIQVLQRQVSMYKSWAWLFFAVMILESLVIVFHS